MPLRSSRRIVAAATGVVLAGVTVAFAASGGRSVEEVSADVVYTHASIRERTCPASDGSVFAEQFVTVQGVAAGDPRLTGDVEVRLRLVTTEAEENPAGAQEGTLRIRTADSGPWKAQGRFWTAAGGTLYTGGIVGKVRDPAVSGGPRSSLTGPFTISFNEDGSVTSQIGGEPRADRTPAAIYSGRCTGPFTRRERDLPPPGGAPGGSAEARVVTLATGWR